MEVVQGKSTTGSRKLQSLPRQIRRYPPRGILETKSSKYGIYSQTPGCQISRILDPPEDPCSSRQYLDRHRSVQLFNRVKHEQLLERIIGQFSRARDLVADFFCGSGTTLVVAQKLGRNWIGCDCSQTAIQLTQGRLERSDFSLIKSLK